MSALTGKAVMSFHWEINLHGKTQDVLCGGELVSSLGTGKSALDLRKGSRRCSKATTMGYSAVNAAGNARIEEWASPFALAKQRIFIEG